MEGDTESLDVDGMLAQSCGAVAAESMKFTIEHDIAGMGCFGMEQIGK